MNSYEYADALKKRGMRCNCDLDNWEPEQSTGHSWVCRIHSATMKVFDHGLIKDVPETAILDSDQIEKYNQMNETWRRQYA